MCDVLSHTLPKASFEIHAAEAWSCADRWLRAAPPCDTGRRRFATEQTVTINTAAVGGNATLLSLGES